MSPSESSGKEHIKWTSAWELEGQRKRDEEALLRSPAPTLTRGWSRLLDEMNTAWRILRNIREQARKESLVFILQATEESWKALEDVMSISLQLRFWDECQGPLSYYWDVRTAPKEGLLDIHQSLLDYIHREVMEPGARDLYVRRFTSLKTILVRCSKDLVNLPPPAVVQRMGLRYSDALILLFQYTNLDTRGARNNSFEVEISPVIAWTSTDLALESGTIARESEDPDLDSHSAPLADIPLSTMTGFVGRLPESVKSEFIQTVIQVSTCRLYSAMFTSASADVLPPVSLLTDHQ